MTPSPPRQFGLHASERPPGAGEKPGAGRASDWMLVVLMVGGLAAGPWGVLDSWPQAVNALRQSGRLVKSSAQLVDMRVVEVPDTRRKGATLWRKEGLFEFQANAVDREEWVTIGEYQKRSEVVPGGYGERHTVWYDTETGGLTTYRPNEFRQWFLLMFHVVLCLVGLSSTLLLGQRLVQRWRVRRAVEELAAGERGDQNTSNQRPENKSP